MSEYPCIMCHPEEYTSKNKKTYPPLEDYLEIEEEYSSDDEFLGDGRQEVENPGVKFLDDDTYQEVKLQGVPQGVNLQELQGVETSGHSRHRRQTQAPFQTYQPHKRRTNQRPKNKMPTSNVIMPTGKSYVITSPATPQLRCGRKPKVIVLSPRGGMGRREYGIVASEMQNTILDHSYCETAGGCFSRYDIIKVEKIVNGCAWRRYQNRKADVIAEAGSANELMLFHGSPSVDTVMAQGFDERFTKDGKLGSGIYFAQHSSVANQFVFGFFGGEGCPEHRDKNCRLCNRRILLCRVTLGRVSEFNFSSMGQMCHPPPEYDSVKGVPGEGGFEYPEYVVYRGEQAYPEYLITYRIAD